MEVLRKYSYDGTVVNSEEEARKRDSYTAPLPTRKENKVFVFKDKPEFQPNLSPMEVLQAGSFGGTYYRPIHSKVTGLDYDKMWLELPQDWLKGLNVKRSVSRSVYNNGLNKYKVKCGGDLDMWESSGWINKQDPYGWFHWYCRFYLGRRTGDDERQIKRWKNCTGAKGRWKNNLIGKICRGGKKWDDFKVSPVVRQILLHWGYDLTEAGGLPDQVVLPPSFRASAVLPPFDLPLVVACSPAEVESAIPVEPPVRILFVDPTRRLPHVQVSAAFYFVLVEAVVVHGPRNASLHIQPFQPVLRQFQPHFIVIEPGHLRVDGSVIRPAETARLEHFHGRKVRLKLGLVFEDEHFVFLASGQGSGVRVALSCFFFRVDHGSVVRVLPVCSLGSPWF